MDGSWSWTEARRRAQRVYETYYELATPVAEARRV
jgi:hypothetical protein